jgi:hypothetical protein
LLLNMRRATNIRIHVADGQLNVELRGWDAFYCCRRSIQLPVEQVAGVGVCRRDLVPAQGFRLPGTSFPGVIRAGSYGTGSRRDFWDVRSATQLLVVQLAEGAPYRRIVLEVPDPRETMLALRPALGPLDLAAMTV